ncbi:hypothetical protein ACLOJK_028387 [Asimina triloba]
MHCQSTRVRCSIVSTNDGSYGCIRRPPLATAIDRSEPKKSKAMLTPSRSGGLEPTPTSSSSFRQQQQGVFPFNGKTIIDDAPTADLSRLIARRQFRELRSASTIARLWRWRPPRQQ